MKKKRGTEELEEKAEKYEANLRRVFSQISNQMRSLREEAREVIDLAFRYVEDAKHFKEKGNLSTSLISLSYAEGLLDALRMMGILEFTWIEKQASQDE